MFTDSEPSLRAVSSVDCLRGLRPTRGAAGATCPSTGQVHTQPSILLPSSYSAQLACADLMRAGLFPVVCPGSFPQTIVLSAWTLHLHRHPEGSGPSHVGVLFPSQSLDLKGGMHGRPFYSAPAAQPSHWLQAECLACNRWAASEAKRRLNFWQPRVLHFPIALITPAASSTGVGAPGWDPCLIPPGTPPLCLQSLGWF